VGKEMSMSMLMLVLVLVLVFFEAMRRTVWNIWGRGSVDLKAWVICWAAN
jgi:hypothetical protein